MIQMIAQLRFLSIHRKYLHPSFFAPSAIALIEDIIEHPPETQYRTLIIECCLHLLITWVHILADTDPTLG